MNSRFCCWGAPAWLSAPARAWAAAAVMVMLWPVPALAQDPSTMVRPALPVPLTLLDALTFAGESHPQLRAAQAAVGLAEIHLREAQASYGIDVTLDLQPRVASRAALRGANFENDSRYGIVVRKRLSDFGRSTSRRKAAATAMKGEELAYRLARDQHAIEVMERFFAVILADLRYQADDESMTVSFFRYKRLADRQQRFEQYSELEVKEREADYREAFVRRLRSDLDRRDTRNRLALALDHPDQLSGDLEMPDLAPYSGREIPDYHELLEQVLAKAPVLAVLHEQVASARASLAAAGKHNTPVLSAEFQARDYAQEIGSRDQYRVDLKMTVPLMDGRRLGATRVARARNRLYQLQAQLAAAEYRLRDHLLEIVHQLQINQAEQAAAFAQEEFRSYYQDRSRALYELELRSDLGDAQAHVAETMWRSARVVFERALLWAELDALLGRPLALIQGRQQQ